MFTRELQQGRLVQPFVLELHRGAYWLTHLQSRSETAAMQAFRQWLQAQASIPVAADAVAEASVQKIKSN
jgi:LysR family transcriptional regulator of beta-lactamase